MIANPVRVLAGCGVALMLLVAPVGAESLDDYKTEIRSLTKDIRGLVARVTVLKARTRDVKGNATDLEPDKSDLNRSADDLKKDFNLGD